MNGITFNAGGLIALDRRNRRVLALLARAKELGGRITVPATALAQAIRSPVRQSRLSRLMRQAGTDLMALDGPDAAAVGLLLARTATDAHVVLCAQRAGQAVIISGGSGGSLPVAVDRHLTSACFSFWRVNVGPGTLSSRNSRRSRTTGVNISFLAYFRSLAALNIQPYLDRVFYGSDAHRPNSPPNIVLNYAYCHSHFHDDRAVVGRTVRLNKHPSRF